MTAREIEGQGYRSVVGFVCSRRPPTSDLSLSERPRRVGPSSRILTDVSLWLSVVQEISDPCLDGSESSQT